MAADALELRAKLFRGLGDPSRLAILDALVSDERNVQEIVGHTGLGQPNVSNHLRCLLDCVTGRPIKAIDALLVHCDCPRTYALRSHGAAFGTHSHGSEKGRIDSAWRNASASVGGKGL